MGFFLWEDLRRTRASAPPPVLVVVELPIVGDKRSDWPVYELGPPAAPGSGVVIPVVLPGLEMSIGRLVDLGLGDDPEEIDGYDAGSEV